MASLKVLAFALLAPLFGASVLAQSPTRLRADASSGQAYGVGRTPTAEEIRAWDISIGPTGEELPPGKGTVREGAQLYRSKGCAGCHGASAVDGKAPILKSKASKDADIW